jgi:hypothetical protein
MVQLLSEPPDAEDEFYRNGPSFVCFSIEAYITMSETAFSKLLSNANAGTKHAMLLSSSVLRGFPRGMTRQATIRTVWRRAERRAWATDTAAVPHLRGACIGSQKILSWVARGHQARAIRIMLCSVPISLGSRHEEQMSPFNMAIAWEILIRETTYASSRFPRRVYNLS